MNHSPLSDLAGVTALAGRVIADSAILENPYFSDLESGAMTVKRFLASQQQFYFAVTYFSRPMSALMMRIDDPEDRLNILENIVEEHGEFRRSAFHEATFRKFLESLGGSSNRPLLGDQQPPVQAFNLALIGTCTQQPICVGVACLGIIEFAFAEIASLIGRSVVQRGWVSQDDLVHYKLHAEIDRQHAADFFSLVAPKWDDPTHRLQVEQGMRLGVYLFDRLYADL
ncbi:iron-containing redox enzyme family protein [Stieleria sp. TO1_6]|uniref:TenA family transcriptional regulator n=1 Tax=Stieleria tagensis TaxID=2956795 RepID=UPI00209B6EB4|nr:iron-containing redox enzyme family protein [Stieleria tagensis]MCO8125133.1 iron-containing redox enzyme family protein [Stieleria tagensis]